MHPIKVLLARHLSGEEHEGFEVLCSSLRITNEHYASLGEITEGITIAQALDMPASEKAREKHWIYDVSPHNGSYGHGHYDRTVPASRQECERLEAYLHHPDLQAWCRSVASDVARQKDITLLLRNHPLEEILRYVVKED